MPIQRRLLVALTLGSVLVLAGCGTTDHPAPPTHTSPLTPTLPHREAPIPGLDASIVLDAARTALPGATELTFPRGGTDTRANTKTKIGYPDPAAADIIRGSPSIIVTWEDDGTVLFVGCSDLVEAGASSPVIAICTGLPVTGIPAGGLAGTWQSMFTGTWDQNQPYPQVSLSTAQFEADRPTPGPANYFFVSGPTPPEASATATSDL